ncbi:sensor histidine kinase [Kribbella antibiotica]|uniref:histidine kinase n=1 Tax=Kribbella antibiotica TaxID=190195 RepID=A0A4R4ZVB9_9ACTN|nr:histidine kinase [Kribbella antibiotica]TDD62144.1 sensor histidine kinase [Kribbella antibiotica]
MHGDSGWLGRVMTAAVAVGVLGTARPADPWVWFALGAGLLAFLAGTVLMAVRPRLTLVLLITVAIVNSLLAGYPDSNSLVLTLLSITTIVVVDLNRTGIRPIIAVGIGVALGFAVSMWWFDRPESWLLTQYLWSTILIAFGLNRRQYEIQVRQTRELLAQTRLAQSEQARAAALDERGRIARDLHDVLAHSLGALSVQLEVAEALLSERRDVDGALERVRRSRRLAVQGLDEARNAVAALRADEVPDLPQALATLAQQHEADHSASVHLNIAGAPTKLDSGIIVALLNAAREALTNAAKHAPGQAVALTLSYGGSVRLEVRNAGPTSGEGFGLTGMRERLALVDGTLTAGADGDDWLVTAEVPSE